MSSLSDGELMRRIRERRRDALELLYDRYSRLVYSYARRATDDESLSSEIVQAVFTRIWTTKADFDAGKGAMANWIITVTRHLSIDVLRRERKHRLAVPIERAFDRPDEDETGDPETFALKNAQYAELAAAKRSLTEPQRRLLDLLYWKGYTLQEIAAMQGEPVGTIKSRLHQSLRLLRRQLQQRWEER